MPRPTLVIGMGRTGRWALTWLKRDLIFANGGNVPEQVRLLAIDLSPERVAVKEDLQPICLGDVELDRVGEVVWLGGDLDSLARHVREGRFPSIGKWYDSNFFLTHYPRANLLLEFGGRYHRQIARLGFFDDLLHGIGHVNSVIWRRLSIVLAEFAPLLNDRIGLEVILVGSLADCFESGILIDLALLVRHRAQELNIQCSVGGILNLLAPYEDGMDQMRVRTFAAWRELNRFMMASPDYPLPMVEFGHEGAITCVQPTKPLLDFCYLMDDQQFNKVGPDELLQFDGGWVSPKVIAAYAVMAQVIEAKIDEKLGARFAHRVPERLTAAYARHSEQLMYSIAGSYLLHVPAYLKREISIRLYAQELLLTLLQPDEPPKKNGQTRKVLASQSRNREDPGFSGWQRAEKLFLESIEDDGKVTRPTRFHNDVGAHKLKTLQTDGHRTIGELDFRMEGDSFIVLDDDPMAGSILSDLSKCAVNNILVNCAECIKNDDKDALKCLDELEKLIRVVFDGLGETFKPRIEIVLGTIKQLQILRFRQLVQAHLKVSLMGRSEDAITARSGKLGYMLDFFRGTVDIMDIYLREISAIRRVLLGRRDSLRDNPSDRIIFRQQVEKILNKPKFLAFILAPKLKRLIKEYFLAAREEMEVKAAMTLAYMKENTVLEMKQICLDVQDELQKWITHLGEEVSSDVNDEIRSLQAHLDEDDLYIAARKFLGNEIDPLRQEEVARGLKNWCWEVKFSNEKPQLTLNASLFCQTMEQEGVRLEVSSRAENWNETSHANDRNRNQRAIINLFRQQMDESGASVLDELRAQYNSPQDFAFSGVFDWAKPLGAVLPEAHPVKRICLFCAQDDTMHPYFKEVESEFRKMAHVSLDHVDDAHSIEWVYSSDSNRILLLRSDELIPVDDFKAWKAFYPVYYQVVCGRDQTPSQRNSQHIFRAERNAVAFESRMVHEEFGDRLLHPHVVTLLDDIEAFRNFIYLELFGLITEQKNPAYHWEITDDETEKAFWLTPEWSEHQMAYRRKPEFFDALYNYVVLRVDWRTRNKLLIDTFFITNKMRSRLRELGRDGEMTLLKKALKEDGFVGRLRRDAKDGIVYLPQRLKDLASVVELMLKDRLDDLILEANSAKFSRPVS